MTARSVVATALVCALCAFGIGQVAYFIASYVRL